MNRRTFIKTSIGAIAIPTLNPLLPKAPELCGWVTGIEFVGVDSVYSMETLMNFYIFQMDRITAVPPELIG